MSTRNDRIAMQDSDDGDPDDTVWVTGFQGSHYHNKEECGQIRGEADEVTREAAQRRWLAPCSKCVLSNRGVRQ